MRKRIIFGLMLLASLGLVVEVDRRTDAAWFGTLVVVLMALLAQFELMKMMRAEARAARVVAALGTCAIFLSRTPLGDAAIFTPLNAFVFSVLAVLVWGTCALQARGAAGHGEILRGLQGGLVSLAYVSLPLSFLPALAWAEGTVMAGSLVLVSKCGDMGGYLVGSQIGRHKVMPRVSPNKSWEGSIGGLLMTTAVLFGLAAASSSPLQAFTSLELVVLALVINLATQIGDFAESMVKRCCEVKDSANLIPTFGGALDIVDSLIFAMPAAVLALAWIK